MDMASPRYRRLSNQTPSARNRLPFFKLLSVGTHRQPTLQAIASLLVTLPDFILRPIAEDSTCLRHGTWRNQAGINLEVSSLLANIYNAKRFYLQCRGGRVFNNKTHLWALWATIVSDLARWAHWGDSDMEATGVKKGTFYCIKATCNIELTSRALTGPKACNWLCHRPPRRV